MLNWLKLHHRAILYFFVALVLFAVVGAWVLFTYYYEDILNTYALPKLQEAALSATNGKYRLKLGSISYHHHTIWLRRFDLYRVKYEAGAKGIAVKRVVLDSVQITGVNIWKILIGEALALNSIQMEAPRLYMTDLAKETPTPPELARDSLAIVKSVPRKVPVITFDSIVLRNIKLYLPDREYNGALPSFAGIHFKLTDFYYNSETKVAQPVLFSKRADIAIPNVKYPIGDGTYALEFKNLRGNSRDSLITADHFGYVSALSEAAFAAQHKYAKARIDFQVNGLRFEGVNFISSLSKANIIFRKVSASSWTLDSYEDKRKPADPHPPPALMPNDIISSLPVKVHIGLASLSGGTIRIRERNQFAEAAMGFDRAAISISDISKDTLDPHPSFIKMSAAFLGAPLEAEADYPLYEKSFNLDLRVALGSFNALKLNDWLVPFERLEIRQGTLHNGKINMKVQNGTATTTVLPLYDDFEVRLLSPSPAQAPGLMEKIKTFVAESFIIKDGNPGKTGVRVGTTTTPRTANLEFMQFLWIAIRKSLGQVIGGFQ